MITQLQNEIKTQRKGAKKQRRKERKDLNQGSESENFSL
jgi:hypothetical protein